MPSSPTLSVILSLFLLCAVISSSAIGNANANSYAEPDDDALEEKKFENILHMLHDRMKKDGTDNAHQILMEAPKGTQAQMNDYMFKRTDKNKDGILSREEVEHFMLIELMPKIETLVNIPKEVMEKKMAQKEQVMHMLIDQMFANGDTNGDGKLSMAEMRSCKMDEKKVEQGIGKIEAKAKAEEANKKKPVEEF